MSFIETLEPWLKGAIGPVVGYALGVATPYSRRLWLKVKGEPDLQIHVEHDPGIVFANAAYNTVGCPTFVPGTTETLDPGDIQDAFSIRRWGLENDGIPAGIDYVEITLTAWEKLDVIVHAVKIDCREIPITEGVIVHALVGGASMERRRVNVSLASFGARAEYFDPTGQTSNFSFKLSGGETAKISLEVHAADWSCDDVCAYEWTAELILLVNNKRKVIKIGDNGKPFEFVRSDAGPSRIWSGSDWMTDW